MTDETRQTPAVIVSYYATRIEPIEPLPANFHDAQIIEFREWIDGQIIAAFYGGPLTAYQRPEGER